MVMTERTLDMELLYLISCVYCTCCISYRIFYRLFIGFFEETKKPGQMDKHDGEPQGIERTDSEGENRTRNNEGTDRKDRTDSRAYRVKTQHRAAMIRQDAAPTRTDINIRVSLSTLWSFCPCGTYGKNRGTDIRRGCFYRTDRRRRERLNDRQMPHTDMQKGNTCARNRQDRQPLIKDRRP
jgi:hypothetical protein